MELTSNEVFNDETYLHFDKVRFEHFNTLNINFKDKNYLIKIKSSLFIFLLC